MNGDAPRDPITARPDRASPGADAPGLIAYARISDLSGKRNSAASILGVQAQHEVCTAMALDAGAVVVQRYTDNDRSASRGESRPGFEAMLTDLYRGRTVGRVPVHGVITVDVDRVYKTAEQWERFVTAFRAAPGRLFADWQGPRDLYAAEADEAGLHDVAVARGENSRRGDRTRRWHAAQARRGVAHTGGRTFGYRPVEGGPGHIEVVPEEAAVIRAAVAACAEGLSWGAITRIFERSGIPTEHGGPWRVQTVKQIISSPRLAGLRLLAGELVTGPDGEPVRGRWEPIITRPEWEAVCARYKPRERAAGGNGVVTRGRKARKYLLSGLLRCGNDTGTGPCRCVMQGCASRAGASAYRYSCRPKADGGCGGTSVRGEWMDGEVADLVLDMLSDAGPGFLRRPDWVRRPEYDAITASRDELDERWRRGEIGEGRFHERRTVLDEILQDLRSERRAWEAVDECFAHGTPERLRRWRLGADEGGYDLHQRRALVFGALESVLVFPSGRGRVRRAGHGYLPTFRASAAER
ncbi:recombinase family protein [Actinomadura terrae]|uniref:recombinase family protein n=1 Tax=Actinomadura terrae TaxID=604353 RepID=UPI001FA71DE5|nr:recombinase family protein [Actinomadura terrae]